MSVVTDPDLTGIPEAGGSLDQASLLALLAALDEPAVFGDAVSAPNLKSVRVEFSTAQLLSLQAAFATTLQICPALGAGKVIVPYSVVFEVDPGATSLTGGPASAADFGIYFPTVASGSTFDVPPGFVTDAAPQIMQIQPIWAAGAGYGWWQSIAETDNQPLVMGVNTAFTDPGGATTRIAVTLFYREFALTL